jgi:hypothetical protein
MNRDIFTDFSARVARARWDAYRRWGGDLWLASGAAIMALLQGCAALPSAAVVELGHTSHITQHEPFQSAATATNYGINVASVGLKWQPTAHLSAVVEDGLSLDRHYPQDHSYGALMGPREVFNARLSYEIPLR